MQNQQFGLHVADLRLPLKEAIEAAAEMDFRHVEVSAAEGPARPEELSASGRRHLAQTVRGRGLGFASLTADYAGLKLADPTRTQERIDRTTMVLTLARDMAVPVVTSAMGALIDPAAGEALSGVNEALAELADRADRLKTILALRPAMDDPVRFAALIREINCPFLQIGVDPAAMTMAGADPFKLLTALPDRVMRAYLRDGLAGAPDRPGQETRLGEGEVDLVGFKLLLDASGYQGPLILRRQHGERPFNDLQDGRRFLDQRLSQP